MKKLLSMLVIVIWIVSVCTSSYAGDYTITLSAEQEKALEILGENLQEEVDGLLEDKVYRAKEMRIFMYSANKTLTELDALTKDVK